MSKSGSDLGVIWEWFGRSPTKFSIILRGFNAIPLAKNFFLGAFIYVSGLAPLKKFPQHPVYN